MNQSKIAIIGLGYVGLPLARLFATKYSVVGFDIIPSYLINTSEASNFSLSLIHI